MASQIDQDHGALTTTEFRTMLRDRVFDDGVVFADLQLAIQAAWIAGDRDLARELATRYELYDVLCLCCAEAFIASTSIPLINRIHQGILARDAWWLAQLCSACSWSETT